MAQERFLNYEQDDDTDVLNRWDIGIKKSGVYAGFDYSPTGSMNLTLVHTLSGVKDVNTVKTLSAAKGVYVTKQGFVIKEDANIVVAISPGSVQPRIDLVVADHAYIATPGGAAASYSVIQGTPSTTPVAPALTDANVQTIIGYLYVPANITDLSDAQGIQFIKNTIPPGEDFSFTDWQALTFDNTNKRASFGSKPGNLWTLTLTGDFELATIDHPRNIGKIVVVKFLTAARILNTGNISVENSTFIDIQANSYFTFISYNNNGIASWRIIGERQGPPAYIGKYNIHTKTIAEGYSNSLTRASNYSSSTKTINTGTDGNHFTISNLEDGDQIENIKISPSVDHSHGTRLTILFLHDDVNDTVLINLGNIDFPSTFALIYDDIENNQIAVKYNDRIVLYNLGGLWYVFPVSDLFRRIDTIETALLSKANSGGPGGFNFATIQAAGLKGDPSNDTKVYFYKDAFKRVWMAGMRLKNTNTFTIPSGTHLWTFPTGFIPINGGVAHSFPIYFLCKRSDGTGSPVVPNVMAVRVESDGKVYSDNTDLAQDEWFDPRPIHFLTS